MNTGNTLMASLALLCLLTAVPTFAAGDTRPANFDITESQDRLDRLIVFPDVKGNVSAVMRCITQIDTSGRMKQTGCNQKDNYDSLYVAPILKAARKARLNPALVDGRPASVFLQFRVGFFAEEDKREIRLYLNPGYEENVAAYGANHVAGQRVIGKTEPWKNACPKSARFAVLALAYLGPDGKAESPSLQHSAGVMPTPNCQQAIVQTILDSRYTPALADGEPVPSTYFEFFGN